MLCFCFDSNVNGRTTVNKATKNKSLKNGFTKLNQYTKLTLTDILMDSLIHFVALFCHILSDNLTLRIINGQLVVRGSNFANTKNSKYIFLKTKEIRKRTKKGGEKIVTRFFPRNIFYLLTFLFTSFINLHAFYCASLFEC